MGVCDYQAIAAFPADNDNVQVVTFNLAAGTWSTNQPIAGTSGAMFAAIATLP